ncbi:MAG: hypothetical protein AAGA77_04275 [Bacteroidota bacterium]
MKTLRLLFASLTLCLFITTQSEAQIITNNTTCFFDVKANVVPAGTCLFTGAGPLYNFVAPTAVIPVPLPSPAGSHWVPGYGIGRPGTPIRVVGHPICGLPTTRFIGFCMGAPAFATYDPATTDLDLHF